jgi:hypothetical protein
VGETDPFFKSSFAIYLLNDFTGLQLNNQTYSAAKVLFKETCKFIVILRNSCDMWKSGKENIQERRGERTNLKHRIILSQTFIFTNIRPSVIDIKRTPKPAASNAS